ncbi:MAG: BREX-2 system adenine-specific DNA-methyltransferase PglX [Hyphomicrobiaceae bacterium]
MIDAQALLRDLKRMVRDLETDLRGVHSASDAGFAIEAEWKKAHDAGRTAHSEETFRADVITQAAVHWVLACVFLRFIEDNGLVDRPWLAGPGERLALARDRHADYFRRNPRDADVDYLIACFDEAAGLPGLAGLFDRDHNPLFRLPLSGDGAMKLLGFLQKVDPDTGALVHDFTDSTWSTRFLGDLYQDLSEAARKRYALLQTPEFVERFILERTLDPALREFGLKEVRLIDPACGSGHFLLGAFERISGLWLEREPGLNPRAAAQRALDAVAGVDINPFAAEIARFRLLLAALKASDIPRLREAPAFKNQGCGGRQPAARGALRPPRPRRRGEPGQPPGAPARAPLRQSMAD